MSFLQSILESFGVKESLFLIAAVLLLKWAFVLITDPLKDVPGPFLARYTNFWLLQQYIKGDFQNVNVDLHERYGPIVRIAPNQYSIDDPNAAKIIYGYGSNFVKAPWYLPWGAADPHLKNLFNELDPKAHNELRRKTASPYSMSSLVSYEPYVDYCTSVLLQRLWEMCDSGATFDMGHWFQCYAFEMILKITFSKSLGFLDSGEDKYGLMKQLEQGQFYSTVVGMYPSLHQPALTLIQKLSRDKTPQGTAYIDAYTESLIDAHKHEKISDEGPSDFLVKFLKVQRENPAKMTDKDIRVSVGANVGAGSDTTSITLSAILYYLCKNPSTMTKLRQELDDATNSGIISDPITFQQAQALPYLQAVVKEGLRIHSATGFTMPRIVPKGGKEITGRYFPEGATVGINSWVAHRNKEVFGSDAYLFRPERWLEKDNSSQLDAYFFAFGQGSRTCIGKNISLLEISKAIPQVVRHIDFHLENEGEWTCENYWFVKPKDFVCRAARRTPQ